MKPKIFGNTTSWAMAGAALIGLAMPMAASATEPCDDFGECKVLIEINSTDGDIGFHWLTDGDDLKWTLIRNPHYRPVYTNRAIGPLRKQKLTETFGESAEPLCWIPPVEDQDEDFDPEDVVTLEEFLHRWKDGTYRVRGGGDGEILRGQTELTYLLPAAPAEVDFDGSLITWEGGDDLGNCASADELDVLVWEDVLPQHPEDVHVDAFEVVLEPDVEDGDPTGNLKFTIRVPGDATAVTVPADYLASLPDDTPVKIEVGAIGGEDNATFTEEDGFCVNEVEGCED